MLHDALEAGIAYTPGRALRWDGRGQEHLALSLASLPPAAIAERVELLGALVRRRLNPTRRRSP